MGVSQPEITGVCVDIQAENSNQKLVGGLVNNASIFRYAK